MTPQLPDDALAALRKVQQSLSAEAVEVGQVWWVPAKHVRTICPWKPPKNRYCVVAAIESTADGDLVHLVAGTTNTASGDDVLNLLAGQGTAKKTSFKFRFSGSLPASTLVADGKMKKTKGAGFTGEQVAAAAQASSNAELRRLCQ